MQTEEGEARSFHETQRKVETGRKYQEGLKSHTTDRVHRLKRQATSEQRPLSKARNELSSVWMKGMRSSEAGPGPPLHTSPARATSPFL